MSRALAAYCRKRVGHAADSAASTWAHANTPSSSVSPSHCVRGTSSSNAPAISAVASGTTCGSAAPSAASVWMLAMRISRQ